MDEWGSDGDDCVYLFIIYFQALTVSITFPVTVIKYRRQKQLKEDMVYFDLQSQDM